MVGREGQGEGRRGAEGDGTAGREKAKTNVRTRRATAQSIPAEPRPGLQRPLSSATVTDGDTEGQRGAEPGGLCPRRPVPSR